MKSALALVIVAGFAASADAATLFSNRGLWTAAAGGVVTTEGFESTVPGGLTLPHVFGSGLTADLSSGSVSVYVDFANTFGFVNTTPAGRNYLAYGTASEPGAYTAEFITGGAMTAFGFDISGFQPGLAGTGGLTIELRSNGGTTLVSSDFVASALAFGNSEFMGLTSATAFDTVRVIILPFAGGAPADFAAFDEVSWAVPAPGAAALLGMGGLLAARRRRA